MAIQPIDLQALFAQQANVGKIQAGMKEAQKIQEAHQQAQAQKKLEEDARSVGETQEMAKDAGTIKEHRGGGAQGNQGGAKGKQNTEEAQGEDEKPALIRNPALGRNIDISG